MEGRPRECSNTVEREPPAQLLLWEEIRQLPLSLSPPLPVLCIPEGFPGPSEPQEGRDGGPAPSGSPLPCTQGLESAILLPKGVCTAHQLPEPVWASRSQFVSLLSAKGKREERKGSPGENLQPPSSDGLSRISYSGTRQGEGPFPKWAFSPCPSDHLPPAVA